MKILVIILTLKQNNMKVYKSNGRDISLDEKSTVLDANPYNFNSYEISELEILYENTNFPKDYWQKLEHQYAGMAMQGFLAGGMEDTYNRVAEFSIKQAHALVQKLKEKEERK